MASLRKRGPRRHYLHRLPQLRQLLAEGRDAEAEPILLGICDTMEREQDVHAVAPWYYAQLAAICRRAGRAGDERAILARFAQQRHAPGATVARLLARLRKLQQ